MDDVMWTQGWTPDGSEKLEVILGIEFCEKAFARNA